NTVDIVVPFFAVSLDDDGNIKNKCSYYFDISDDSALKEYVLRALSSGENKGVLQGEMLRFLVIRNADGMRIAFADTTGEHEILNNLIKMIIIVGIASELILFFISFFLSTLVVKPVDNAWKQQHRFVSDVSHELKTPLTVIMTNAELLSNGFIDSESGKRYVRNITIMSKRMHNLVDSLLELARAENTTMKTVGNETDISEVVLDSLLPFEPLFYENGLRLETEIEEGIFAPIIPDKLSDICGILLDNALKYSVPGGKTIVRLKKAGSRKFVLSCANEGEAISRENLTRIFDRFYRGDENRKSSDSFGLGLAIAKHTVEAYGGKIYAESKNGVNTFTAEMPI
ncbi:MAG: HAMP domain-containing histidine kinase, partial [Oscillospiraceae bacterium]|nr:HAMP domain-containing histidine kinase [Oscillospiraceae bacterium]